MKPVAMNEAEVQMRLRASVSGLADRVPLVSARSLVTRQQRNGFIGLLVLLVIGAVLDVGDRHRPDRVRHALLPGRRRVPGVPLHSLVKSGRPRDRDGRGSIARSGFQLPSTRS